MEDQYKVLTLSDGQQVLVQENQNLSVSVGILTDGEDPVTVEKSESIDVTEAEYHVLLEEAMTKTIDVDTITGKAQAVTPAEAETQSNEELQDKNNTETQE